MLDYKIKNGLWNELGHVNSLNVVVDAMSSISKHWLSRTEMKISQGPN